MRVLAAARHAAVGPAGIWLHFPPAFKQGYGGRSWHPRGSSQRLTVADGQVRGHHQIPVIRQACR